ncbi:MAG: hypothetical protein HC919_08980 [Oscillatoriales cyanobacterium SM2_2_1]|nr:hypothetical protein [Oscillatoriales cyanobacterium SM2_2_1]
MDAFSPIPPAWTQSARRAPKYHCPQCDAQAAAAQAVWINRRTPLFSVNHQRQWQEFYWCSCGQAWWGWSGDRQKINLHPNPRAGK